MSATLEKRSRGLGREAATGPSPQYTYVNLFRLPLCVYVYFELTVPAIHCTDKPPLHLPWAECAATPRRVRPFRELGRCGNINSGEPWLIDPGEGGGLWAARLRGSRY